MDLNELVKQSLDLQEKIQIFHIQMQTTYSKYFSELESINLTPLQYSQVVSLLVKHKSSNINDMPLDKILPPATVMVISLLASSISKQEIDAADLSIIEHAGMQIGTLSVQYASIIAEISSKLTGLAPNLCMLVGDKVASLLITSAGSLDNLAKIPSSNLQLLGYVKSTGLKPINGSESKLSHCGYLGECSIVKEQPVEFQRKALRLVSAKCSLCSRMDLFQQFTDGSKGNEMRDEIEQKLAKAQEPAPYKQTKPLPAPIEIASKRRGGRRARARKELLQETHIRKLQNRVAFGSVEKEVIVGDDIEGLGMLTDTKKMADAAVNDKLRTSIKKLAAKNKIFSSFMNVPVENVREEPSKKEEKKFKWF